MKIGSFEAYFQPDPNVVVLRGLGQHVVVTSRVGQVHDFMIEDAAEIATKCVEYEKATPQTFVRLRRYWGDNSHGNGCATVQVLHSKDVKVAPASFTFPDATSNGQSLVVDITAKVENIHADRFEPNGSLYYENDPD